MKINIWLLICGILGSIIHFVVAYGIGYYYLGISIHFGRVMFAVAVLWLYIGLIRKVFVEVPPPSRDYLVTGIILSWISSLLFAFWNEAGAQFDWDRSIFTSPIAGYFSLILVTAGLFHWLAPNVSIGTRIVAAAVGSVVAFLIVVVPRFL